MSNHSVGYFLFKAEQKKAAEAKAALQSAVKNQSFIKSTQTRHTTIPDMRDAYEAVVAKNHQPSRAEIHYRRFVSGRVLDNSKDT